MKNQEIKKHIDVDGAVLTDCALDQIKRFQHSDNELAKIEVSNLADAICFVELLCAHEINNDSELVTKARNHIANLIDIREEIKLLQKP